MGVNVVPLPRWARELPARWRVCHPPVFDGDPTPEEIALALALIDALDPESRHWYGGADPRLPLGAKRVGMRAPRGARSPA